MSRTNVVFAIGGAAVAAGLVGWAVGTLYAPASGQEVRRRLVWKTDEQWRAIARASERWLQQVAACAAAEIDELKTRFVEPAHTA
ncbi:MAG: YtxH domain-containing protein [Acidobacteria bacterium]|nr:YtxH domain-containing protein [Acidobacteriota bacterium]